MLFKQSGALDVGASGGQGLCVCVCVCLSGFSGHGNNGPLECEVTGALTPGK